MTDNILFYGITLFGIILGIIVSIIEIRKKTKYPFRILFFSIFLTIICVLLIITIDKLFKQIDLNRKKQAEIVILVKAKEDSLLKARENSLLKAKVDSVLKAKEESISKAETIANANKMKQDSIIDLKLADIKNYYNTNFYGYGNMYLRSRALTFEEVNICNQCISLTLNKKGEKKKEEDLLTSERTIYEDMNNQICIQKKRIDDETYKGFIRTGVLVVLLETNGSFSHIKIISNGIDGWISSRLGGKPTLVK